MNFAVFGAIVATTRRLLTRVVITGKYSTILSFFRVPITLRPTIPLMTRLISLKAFFVLFLSYLLFLYPCFGLDAIDIVVFDMAIDNFVMDLTDFDCVVLRVRFPVGLIWLGTLRQRC